jgi:glycosyltransferase involved in cell wall biosynthesis
MAVADVGDVLLRHPAHHEPPAGLHAVMAIQACRPHLGGAEVQLERLVPHLAARGIRTEILTRGSKGCPRQERIAGSVVHRTPVAGESRLASVVYVAAAVTRILRHRSQINLVHAHGALSPATIALGGRLLRLPCLVTVLGTGPHGDLARLANKPLGRLRARLLFRFAWFAALSADAREELVGHGVPCERILTLPNGVDLDTHRPARRSEREQLRKELGLPPHRFVGVFVGRLHPVKDVDTLLQATARVPELALVVVGDGPDRRRLEAKTDLLGIADRVNFLGESSRVPAVLRASDAFMLSSHGEGMSNALLEAMASGLPCLASRTVGGANELLGGGRGMLVADGDVAAWAAAIGRIIDDPGLRSSTGNAAAEFVADTLSLEATAERLARAYAHIVDVGVNVA